MLLLSHSVAGAIIGQKIGNPFLVSALALASHFLLDVIPHWNYLDRKKNEAGYSEEKHFELWKYMEAVPDIVISSIMFIFFLFNYPNQWVNIGLGVIFATLPDFITFTTYIPYLRVFFRPFNKLHYALQGNIKNHNKVIVGLATQIAFFVVAILILTH